MPNYCNLLDLGCVPSCGFASISSIILESGNYTLKYKVGSTQYSILFSYTDSLILDLEQFPMNRELLFSIYNEDNEKMTITIDEEQYNCFRIQTVIGMVGNEVQEIIPKLWTEIINGDGSETYFPEHPITDNSILIVDKNGVILRKDDTLNETNSYKIDEGSIVLDIPLTEEEYIQITKIA